MDLYGRMSLPVAITFIMVLITALPSPFPAFGDAMPALPLMAIYYWSIHRPDLLPGWAVFLIGLFEDLLTGAPLGLGVCLLLLTHVGVASQRRFFLSRPFVAAWGGLAVVVFLVLFLRLVLHNALTGYMIGFGSAFFQYILTIFLYPLLAGGLALVQLKFLRHEEA